MKHAILLIACCLLAAGCHKGAQSLCTGDVQCQAGFSCDPLTGACRCDNDSSCGSAEMCNAAGFCQPRLRCDSTADCAGDSICDTRSGVCIPKDTCSTLDVQCQAGQVCQDFTCLPGCRLDGDCASPSDVCRPCAAGTSNADCPLGTQCVRGKCDSEVTCHYGDLCASDGTGDKVCTPDTRGPFCQPCVRQAGSPDYCPDDTGHGNGNYCLVDASKPLGQAFYCGVDCSEGQECPFGYTCHDVRIVRFANCDPQQGFSACAQYSSAVHCDPAKDHAGPPGIGGVVNDDCENAVPALVGAVCDPKSQQCVPQCLGTGETGVQAFCSCLQDSDCPQDSCVSSTRTCFYSGQPCIAGQTPDDCQSIHAIHCAKSYDSRLGAVGYCRLGQNCAPGQGYTCSILLPGK